MSFLMIHFVRHAPVINPDNVIYDRDIDCDLSCQKSFDSAATQLPSPSQAIWVTSPLLRAVLTTQKLLDVIKSPAQPIVMHGFREKERGPFAGKRYEDVLKDKRYQEWDENRYHANIPDVENETQLKTRVDKALSSLFETMVKHNKTQAVVVCHEGVIRHTHFYGRDLPENPEDLRGIEIPYVSVHSMQFEAPSTSQQIDLTTA